MSAQCQQGGVGRRGPSALRCCVSAREAAYRASMPANLHGRAGFDRQANVHKVPRHEDIFVDGGPRLSADCCLCVLWLLHMQCIHVHCPGCPGCLENEHLHIDDIGLMNNIT